MKKKLLFPIILFCLLSAVVNSRTNKSKEIFCSSFTINRLFSQQSDTIKKIKKVAKVRAVLSPPTTIAGSSCGDGLNFVQVNVYANGASTDEIMEWFVSQKATNPVFTGYVYSPGIKTTKTYYVQSRSKITDEISIRVPVVASVYLTPPAVTLSVSPNNSETDLLCEGTPLTFTAGGGGDLFEFSIDGAVVQPMSTARSFTTTTLVNNQNVSVRTRYTKTIDGQITEPAWGTGPLEENVFSAAVSSNASNAYVNALKVSPEENKVIFGLAGKVSKDKSLLVFLDSKAGGFNKSDYGDVLGVPSIRGFNYFNNNPSTFDSYFQADYCLVISTDASEINYFADIIELKSGESIRTSLGSASQGSPSSFFGVNKNNTGVTDYNLGFEVEILKSQIGYTTGDMKFFAFSMQDASEGNYAVTNSFLSPETSSTVDFGNGAIDYNLRDPNAVVFASSALTPCYMNAYFTVNFFAKPEPLRVEQPSCLVPTGTIEIVAQNGAEYSIDGVNYQSSAIFDFLSPNSYTLYIRKAADGTCVNVSSEVVVINNIPTSPAAPTAESVVQPTCAVPSGTITIAVQAGVEYSLDGINYVMSNSFSGLVPGSYTLYVRNIGDVSCKSSSTSNIVIDAIPPPPISPVSGGNRVECESSPIQTLTASATVSSGETVVWYTAAMGGSIVSNPILNTVGTITYYAQAENATTNCSSSSRTAVTLTINPKPAAPISAGDITECAQSPIQTLTASVPSGSGETVIWYTAASGGTVVSSPTLNTIGTVTYYAELSNTITSCKSDIRTSVTLTINANPAQPVSGGDQIVCALVPIQTLTATATTAPGESIVWYTAASGGIIVANPTLNMVGTVTYYAQAINSTTNCTSNSRTAVSLTINPNPENPISGGNKTECVQSPVQTLTATATTASGESVIWYTAASGGTIVSNPILNTIGTVTYYAEGTNDLSSCSSTSRTPVTLTINPKPAPPISGGNQAVCAQAPVQTITATATVGTGESVVWYNASSGGTIVNNPFLNVVGSITYYAETRNNATGCISSTRTSVSLTIDPSPDAPLSAGNKIECVQEPIQTLTAIANGASGESITWYDAATAGNIVSNPILNSVGMVTYYAESSNGLCKSLNRTAVTLTIIGTVADPVGSDQTVCSDGTANQSLTATASGNTITWYTAAVGGITVSNPNQIGIGTSTFYAESSVGNCKSNNRTKVTLTILALPPKPTVESVIQPTCITTTGAITLASQGAVEYSIGNGFQDSPIFSNLSSGTYTPIVRFKANTLCEVRGNPQQINPIPAEIQFVISGNCEGKDFILTATPLQNSYDSGNVDYQWKDNNGVMVGTNSNLLNVSESLRSARSNPVFPLSYSLTISSVSSGCEASSSSSIESIYCDIQKGISPDGNGMNESFDLTLLDVKKLEVFDRYGIKVYSKNDYTNQWRGQSDKGEDLPSATYYYVIEFNNAQSKTGWIYLIREK
jgi:gliding motility-associated-like protein